MTEYLRRGMLQSAPAPETTAFTLKSIRELLAETGDEHLLRRAPAEAETPAAPPSPAPALQQPPRAASRRGASVLPDLVPATAPEVDRAFRPSTKRSLGARLAGLFARG